MCHSTGYGFQGLASSLFSILNRVSFWTGSFEPYMWVPTIFKSNSMMSFIKKILSVWEMKNKAGKKHRTQAKYKGLVLNRVAK